MGGKGSGRLYRWDRRQCVSEARRLDIRALKKQNVLIPGKSTDWAWWKKGGRLAASITIKITSENDLYLSYSTNGKIYAYPVAIQYTHPHLGGRRPWFICNSCGKRVAILYHSDHRFICRVCAGLTYDICQKSGNTLEEAMSRVDRVRRKLNAQLAPNGTIPLRPNGMHLRTYSRLMFELSEAEKSLWEAMAASAGIKA